MLLFDVNILLPAFRPDFPGHAKMRDFLERETSAGHSFGLASGVLSAVIRIVTNPKATAQPNTAEEAIAFCETLLERPGAVLLQPGLCHWGLFIDLCRQAGATGNLVPDVWFAALAMEHGCTWITLDQDYAGFPGLRWRFPRRTINRPTFRLPLLHLPQVS